PTNDQTAVCKLGFILLDSHLTPAGAIDHEKLRATIRMAVRALDNVIDINFYPTEAAKRSNMRHRPIGLGVMGLAHALYLRGHAFASPEAVEVPRGGLMDWAPVRAKIAQHGMRNSNVLAIAPTATISNITATSPCIEPTYKNLFVKSNLSGEFIVLNPFLVKDLKSRGLWNQDMMDNLKYFDGELKDIDRIPADLKQKYLTAFGIDPKWVVDAAARRQKWIDQSQAVNLRVKNPDLKTLSHMYRYAWHAGLKTTYYLRGLGA